VGSEPLIENMMRLANRTPDDLYEVLTGPQWRELAESVRRFHGPTCPAECRGSVRIARSNGILAGIISRVLGLPQPAGCAAAGLVVTRDKGHHKWIRRLGNRSLVTRQSAGRDGLLAERFGPIELGFRLRVKNGALHFEQNEVRFRLMGATVPVPRWASPKISAVCEGSGAGAQVRIWVEVSAPVLGVLLSYDGLLERDE
jgi:hypothetical protein